MNTGSLRPGLAADERMCQWYEIELITASRGGGVVTQQQFLPARRGTIYVRKPGDIVQGIPPYSYCGVVFDTEYDPSLERYYRLEGRCMHAHKDPVFLNHILRRGSFFEFLETLPRCLEVKNFDLFYHLLESSADLYAKHPPDYHLHAKNLLLQLIIALADETAPEHRGADTPSLEVVRGIRGYIDTHYMERMDLKLLAQRASMSREHLCRTFKQVYGEAPIEYLTSIRLLHAKQMLMYTHDTVGRIARLSGFASEQCFYDAFKRRNRLTPGQYRAGGQEARAPE